MNDFIAQILVVTAQVIIIAAMLSQYIKIVTSKTVKGLSGWAYTLATGSVIAWTVYGYKKGLVVYYISHILTTLIYFGILGHFYNVSRQRRKMEAYAVISGIVLLTFFIILPNYAGWVGLAYTLLARIPQYIHIFKDDNIRGVSSLSYLLLIIACTCTVIYAAYYNLFPMLLSAAITIASSLFIMFMVAKKSLRAYN